MAEKKNKNIVVLLVVLVLAMLVMVGMTAGPHAAPGEKTTTGQVTIRIQPQPMNTEEGTVSIGIEKPEQSANE